MKEEDYMLKQTEKAILKLFVLHVTQDKMSGEDLILCPNCSEFVFRLPLKDLNKKEVDNILDKVDEWSKGKYDWRELFPNDSQAYELDVQAYGWECDGEKMLLIDGHTGDMGQFVKDWLENVGFNYDYFDEYDDEGIMLGKDIPLDCEVQTEIK